jgi:hypothetical protein
VQRKNTALTVVLALLIVYLLLSIPGRNTHTAVGAGNTTFTWNQNRVWQSLEVGFREARAAGCSSVNPKVKKGIEEGRRHLKVLAGREFDPSDPLFNSVEANLFGLGPLVAACPENLEEYSRLISSLREKVKVLSRTWDVRDRAVRDRLYRLLYGGRAALEEVMLQAPDNSSPAILHGTKEPSQTPSFQQNEVLLHSGDVLVSRGGAPTSALIARGNDYPGNFSHIAFLYVDEETGTPSVIEAHIEEGVVISSLEEYLKDVKLRIMVLRVRSDHPLLINDPLLPHRAAKMAYDEARTKHIPYDFEMDYIEPSKRFCSEVASHAYASFGVTLWNIITTMSSPGVVDWLADFGVRHFKTQAPADLEYDPQLVVVAEWRDMAALWDDHVDNAIIEVMLDGADKGDRISYNRYLLAPARLVKAYSAVLNRLGSVGPVPEGMNTVTALKSQWLDKKHNQTKQKVLSDAQSFENENGYRPPYWELVNITRAAYKADSNRKLQ